MGDQILERGLDEDGVEQAGCLSVIDGWVATGKPFDLTNLAALASCGNGPSGVGCASSTWFESHFVLEVGQGLCTFYIL